MKLYRIVRKDFNQKLKKYIIMFFSSIFIIELISWLFINNFFINIIPILILIYIIFFFFKYFVSLSLVYIVTDLTENNIKICIGNRGYLSIKAKDIIKIEKEDKNYCIYFKENSLKLLATNYHEYYENEYEKILTNKKIILDERFFEEDIQELKKDFSL